MSSNFLPDPLITFFSRFAQIPQDLRDELLRMQSQPAHLATVSQILASVSSSEVSEMIPTIKKVATIDGLTADLQFAESYLIEANELREAGDYISASALYEMAKRLCQNVENSPASEIVSLRVPARQWKAECVGNLGLTLRSAGDNASARTCLEMARDLFQQIGNYSAAAHINKLLSSEPDPSIESISPPPNVVIQARDALDSNKLMKFFRLAPSVVSFLQGVPFERRLELASELLGSSGQRTAAYDHYRTFVTKNLQVNLWRDSRFLWCYFTAHRCYGCVSIPSLLFMLVHLVESLSAHVPSIVDRTAFRAMFADSYEEAFRWALSKQRFLFAARLHDQLKARATLDLMLLRRRPEEVEKAPTITATSEFSSEDINQAAAHTISPLAWSNDLRWYSIGQFESRLRQPSARQIVKDRREFPAFFSINASRRVVNVGSLILQYAICEDFLHVFAAPSTRYQDDQGRFYHWMTKIGVPPDSRLTTSTAELLNCFISNGTNTMPTGAPSATLTQCELAGSKLYKLLIQGVTDHWTERETSPPLEELVSCHHHLVIVPSGALCMLPWLALRTPKGWLWQNHLVSVVPSLFFQWTAAYLPRPMVSSVASVLLVGNPTGDLIGSEAECNQIESFLQASGIRVKKLLGNAATIAAVLNSIPEHDMLHFACHGKNIRGNPADSFLLLADGRLKASDIVALDLDGKAVVLSACESGLGEVGWSDDSFSLAHASLVGGARYVLGSLWKVADLSTSLLMGEFYWQLLLSRPPQMALNLAIRKTYQQYPSPYDWSAFVLFGSPEDTDAQSVVRRTFAFAEVAGRTGDRLPFTIYTDPTLEEKQILTKGL